MKLRFDPHQQYQLDAINAVVRVFEGQPVGGHNDLRSADMSQLESDFANHLALAEEQILQNTQAVQRDNRLAICDTLDGMHFSVEMETGTGKTYVYLRTIYELYRTYGFSKFVIVVPSVAIREGVRKNLHITHEHLQNLYGKTSAHFAVYDARKIAQLRSFAMSNTIEILVINIDSFATDENVINRPNDRLTGERPITFVQRVNPIVIVDEPQNMETTIRRQAIANLHYLCTLRYSATHTNHYNMLYRLDPVRAYDMGLVKQIEVCSIIAQDAANHAYVRLKQIKRGTSLSAALEIDCNSARGVKRKTVTLQCGADLYASSGKRALYKNGYIVNAIDAQAGCVTLSNGATLYVGGAPIGDLTDELLQLQIRKTVEEHFEKACQLQPYDIKVISLFFVDKVAHYRSYDETGAPQKGKFALWFEEAFRTFARQHPETLPFDATQVHDGYFSQDKGRWKDTSGVTKADAATFTLIMRDKERLLDAREPLRFIFSHSALREGWDNPNVFQICTLNETGSERKKRQEIGRGLRLPVDSRGNRIQDTTLNRLTVIANDSYEDFARGLQEEIREECGVDFGGRIRDRRTRHAATYRKGFQLDKNFSALWDKIKHRTIYRVEYTTEELIKKAAQAVRDMDSIEKPWLRVTKVDVQMRPEHAPRAVVRSSQRVGSAVAVSIPDILTYIQHQDGARLTRSTIYNILERSGRLADALVNPQLFMDKAAAAIRETLAKLMIDGIQYEQIADEQYELRLFKGFEFHKNEHTFEITRACKTIYAKLMPLDSGVEHEFAQQCENRDDIPFYFKLPHWFKIRTPIGDYNPDWALIKRKDDAEMLYFVAETKAPGQELRPSEKDKIRCAAKHYAHRSSPVFKQITTVDDLDPHT